MQPGQRRLSGRWRLMLKVGDSFGLATHENRLVASGLTVPFHSQFGWISMILVDCAVSPTRAGYAPHGPLHRGAAGAGADRLSTSRRRGRGLPVSGVQRRLSNNPFLSRRPLWSNKLPPPGVKLRQSPRQFAAVTAHDTPIFGADRRFLIEHPRSRRAARRPAAISLHGGRASTQIGPLVADDRNWLLALLASSSAPTSVRFASICWTGIAP